MSRSAKSIDNSEGFKTDSYAGSDIAELRLDGEKPPRTAKLVVELSWSWGPAHSRTSTYLLSTDRKRSAWYLWERGTDYDTGKSMYARAAWGEPYHGYSASFAAKHLLAAAWQGEMNQGWWNGLEELQEF